jgi:hypothetical protein
MAGVRQLVALHAMIGLLALVVGCSQARQDVAPSTSGQSSSNERTLTHAQSVHLVKWATTWRACMASRGWELGQLERTPTHLSMDVPTTIEVSRMLSDSAVCGDAQGGPPAKSSLQYRTRTILLYLPKQCLLDPKVVSG